METDVGTFRHNQTYPGIIQVYSDAALPWHIQNCGISKTLPYSEPEAYSEQFWFMEAVLPKVINKVRTLH